MKPLVAVTVCCAFLACASNNSNTRLPELQLVQLSGPAEQSYTPGNIEVQYGLRIANRAAETITLRNIQVQTVGSGGSYRLVPGMYHFQREIGPGQSADVTFWAKAIAGGDAFAPDVNAPITVRATAIFDAASGGFRRVVTKMLEQR